jgi:hypothetical protein
VQRVSLIILNMKMIQNRRSILNETKTAR